MILRAGVLRPHPSTFLQSITDLLFAQYDHAKISALSQRLINGITSQVDHVYRNGDPNGYPGCVNLSFAYIEGESFLMAMKVCHDVDAQTDRSRRLQNIALSSGSACTSASLEPSYVLRALGATDDIAHSSIRFGIGRFTTEEEVDYVVRETVKTVNRLRELRFVVPSRNPPEADVWDSPLWEMVQEGIDITSINWSQH